MIQTQKTIDFGHVGYIHPNAQGCYWSSKEGIEHFCREHNEDPALISFADTRPTIDEIFKQLKTLEREACGQQTEKYGTVGPWEEYFSLQLDPNSKFPPNNRWIAVYVVTGGSEGIYLHVDLIDTDGKRKTAILGKTLSNKGMELWESAGRIAGFLQA